MSLRTPLLLACLLPMTASATGLGPPLDVPASPGTPLGPPEGVPGRMMPRVPAPPLELGLPAPPLDLILPEPPGLPPLPDLPDLPVPGGRPVDPLSPPGILNAPPDLSRKVRLPSQADHVFDLAPPFSGSMPSRSRRGMQVVPEPGTALLLASGLVALAAQRSRSAGR